MAKINYGTLAKEVDGVVEYVYPVSNSDIVEYDESQSVKDKILSMDREIDDTNSNLSALRQTVIDSRISIDIDLNDVSENPVQNKAVVVALRNKSDRSHTHTPSDIGAASADHSHTPSSIGAASADHSHTPESIGAADVGHTHRPIDIGAADRSHSHSAESVGAADRSHTHTPESIGAADRSHSHAASDIGAAPSNHTHNNASANASGFMSAADKVALDELKSKDYNITIDSSLSSSSTNPVQNKVLKAALDGKSASNHTHAKATQLADGLMSKEDKSKLDMLDPSSLVPSGPETTVTVDAALSSSSTNPVQNKVVKQHLDAKADSNHTHAPESIGAAASSHTHSNATASTSGFMSGSDKSKLDTVNTALPRTLYGISSTSADTSSKIIALQNFSGTYTPRVGDVIFVKFNNGNNVRSGVSFSFNNGSTYTGSVFGLYAVETNVHNTIFPKLNTNEVIQVVCYNASGNGTFRLNKHKGTKNTHGQVMLSDLTSGTSDADGGVAATPKAVSDALAAAKSYTDTKVSGVSGGSTVTVDSSLSSSSTNPVQNKVVKSALDGKAASNHTHTASSIGAAASSHSHSVATSSSAGFMSSTDKARLDTAGGVYYATCSTSKSTSPKVLSGLSSYTPKTNDVIFVYFSNGLSKGASIKLSINSTQYSVSGTVPADVTGSNIAVPFIYTGGSFMFPPIGGTGETETQTISTATNSVSGITKLSDSTSSTLSASSGGTAASPKAVSDALAAAKSYASDGLDTLAAMCTYQQLKSVTLSSSAASISLPAIAAYRKVMVIINVPSSTINSSHKSLYYELNGNKHNIFPNGLKSQIAHSIIFIANYYEGYIDMSVDVATTSSSSAGGIDPTFIRSALTCSNRGSAGAHKITVDGGNFPSGTSYTVTGRTL